MKIKLEYVLILALTFAIGGAVLSWHLKKIKVVEVPKIVEVVKTDTILVEKVRKIKLPAKIVKIVDTLKIYKQVDSEVYDNYEMLYSYACADTAIDNDNLYLDVKYWFDNNYFDINYKLKQKELIKYIEKEKKLNWKDKLGISIGWQTGYDFVSKRLYQGIGLNIGYKIK